MTVVKADVVAVTGPVQLCAGVEGGSETAVHTLCEVFEADDTEGVLFVYAANAFNNLNRKAAGHNIHSLCPAV